MDNFLEPTWRDLYYRHFPQYLKDETFSGQDIIRFFERNLSFDEQVIVRDYFDQFCVDDDLLDLIDDVMPEVPNLPIPHIPFVPLLPIPMPFLPPPQTLPPYLPSPTPLLPIIPLIIIPAASKIISDLVDDIIGVPEVQAAEVEIVTTPGGRVIKSNLSLSYKAHPAEFSSWEAWQASLCQNGTEVCQNGTEVPQIETKITEIQEDDVLFPWQIAEYETRTIPGERFEETVAAFEIFWHNLTTDSGILSNWLEGSLSFEDYWLELENFGYDKPPPTAEVIWIDYGTGRLTREELDALYDEYAGQIDEEVLFELLYGDNL